MSLLISRDALRRRRLAARGEGALAPLAESLRSDLGPLLVRAPRIPAEKALLSRDGGRCPRDAAALEFDPFAPREHRCPVCGEVFSGERHYLAWVMWYQLWLAERAVHAAALHALTGEVALADLARGILFGYTDRYAGFPNRDNVLGPGRVFFSTYLESIWLLQLCVALDLLELAHGAGALGGSVRERIIAPSAAIIASYDEGGSNRQVWNDAALLAAGRLLEDDSMIDRAVYGASGLVSQIERGLFADGSWYEGENYHLFAHRGLWYGVTIAECAGLEIPAALRERFQEGFAAPLATALPDFTFPSRRDSQYGISLRQWRFAESCELGLAREPDARLASVLGVLYAPGGAPSRDTGRWRSTAESERNEPAAALSRADLGWRSLLLALEAPSSLGIAEPTPSSPATRSVVMEGQGIGVFRREGGEVYHALDYGQSGGGHGHPDRLNVLLMRGAERWLDDMGTGSYVDPSLRWYRSTLAHGAPLVDGRSQPLVDGVLRAFEERDDEIGWLDAELPDGRLSPGVRVRRSLVAMPDYSIDRLEWESRREVRLELPLHLSAEPASTLRWEPAKLDGSPAPEDGFEFVHHARRASVGAVETVELRRDDAAAVWVATDVPVEWWRAIAPGAPGHRERDFYILRMKGERGVVTMVWNWGGALEGAALLDHGVRVERTDGSRDDHLVRLDGWEIERRGAGGTRRVSLGGVRSSRPAPGEQRRAPGAPPRTADAYLASAASPAVVLSPGSAVSFDLGRDDYRISEESWEEAGRPRATVALDVRDATLAIQVDVAKPNPFFRAADAPDPRLDNENPDINSDGVQLHLYVPEGRGEASWLVVPEPAGHTRIHCPRGPVGAPGAGVPLTAYWRPTPAGYAVSLSVALPPLGARAGSVIGVRIVVNDMASTRVRRRGQLVLGGVRPGGEHVYLRGDREDEASFLRFVLGDG